ncbi:MAG: AraC family transcriptional regulator [Clostridia bacterium]|nr:AraC family transcriptional regulator [Clostridia bacterium]
MKISIPEHFINQKPSHCIKMEDASVFNYKVYASNEKVYVHANTNLFIFILKGEKLIKLSKASASVKNGEAIFIKKGNYIMNQIVDLEDGMFESIVVCISDALITEFVKNFWGILEIQKPAIANNEFSFHCFTMSDFVRKEVEAVVLHFINPSCYSKEILKLKLFEMLLTLINENQSIYQMLNEVRGGLKIDLKRYMEENFDKALHLDEFARNTRTSLTTFKRNFKKVFGESPKTWINKKRLEKAVFLLESTDFNVTEICFSIGFENLSYFIKLFKDAYGISPGQYKEKFVMNR